jgi:hypothetical protein
MIQLPPGCKLNYSIWIDVTEVNDEICEWFKMIGGTVITKETYHGRSLNPTIIKDVQYGQAKPSYHRQDGSGHVKINFHGNDANAAYMFILKFNEHVVAHNMKEYETYVY